MNLRERQKRRPWSNGKIRKSEAGGSFRKVNPLIL